MSFARAGAAVAMGLALIVVPAGNGAQRGGNHGCDQAAGTVRSDHFWKDGDRVIAGYYTQEVGFPVGLQETVTVANPGRKGSGNRLNCGGDVGTYRLFTSDLGPGNDRARLDAVGIQQQPSEPTAQPLPRAFRALISGGAGNDRLLGHSGRDKFEGNSGDDVIKVAGGKRDKALCGRGDDKAVVDRKDKVEGCERVVLRRP